MDREQVADHLEENRARLVSLLADYPLEFTQPAGEHPELRAVIASPQELETLIAQLRAEHVSPEEALNPTLVR